MAFRSEIQTETTIEATAAEVWSVLTDFPTYGEWNPGMESVEGEAVAGSRLTIRFAPRGRRAMTMRPTVLTADPGHELRWLGRLLVPGLFDGEHWFTIEPAEPGSVRFVQAERFRGLLVPFLRRLIEVDTPATFRAVNDALAGRVAQLRTSAA